MTLQNTENSPFFPRLILLRKSKLHYKWQGLAAGIESEKERCKIGLAFPLRLFLAWA